MAAEKIIKIFIVDDHPMVIEGLSSLINNLNGTEVCGFALNGKDALKWIRAKLPDIVLLDINLPDINGVDLCKKIRQLFAEIKILGISTYSERSYISRMIENGASGYLIKNASHQEIASAIKTVMDGKIYMNQAMQHLTAPLSVYPNETLPELTKREKEILEYIADGYTNNKIAEKLFISASTVDTHRKNMLIKLNVNNTAALIKVAVQKGLI